MGLTKEDKVQLGRAVLDFQMPRNNAGAKTIRDYLTKLLRQVIRDGERFSGKRPFGSSDWKSELALAFESRPALIKLRVERYEDGGIEIMDYDERKLDMWLDLAISSL